MPVTTALLVSAGVGAAKVGYGAYQNAKGNKIKKGLKAPVNPTYNIPQSATDALGNAKAIASRNRLPGQTLLEQRLGAKTASGARAMTDASDSSASLMAGLAGLKGNEMNAENEIGIQAANYEDANQKYLNDALGTYANYQDKEFQYNKIAPYQSELNKYNLDYNNAQALKGAGEQNIYGGLDTIGGAASIYGSQSNKTGVPGQAPIDPKTGMPIQKQTGGLNFPNNMKDGGLVGKYQLEKRRGFKGSYKDWISSQGSNFQMDFNLK